MFNLIGLLDLDADADRVDAGLDQDTLVLVARDGQRREQNLGGRLGFDLGDIMSLCRLRRKIGQGQCRGQAAADALQVRSEGLRLGELRVSRRDVGGWVGLSSNTMASLSSLEISWAWFI